MAQCFNVTNYEIRRYVLFAVQVLLTLGVISIAGVEKHQRMVDIYQRAA